MFSSVGLLLNSTGISGVVFLDDFDDRLLFDFRERSLKWSFSIAIVADGPSISTTSESELSDFAKVANCGGGFFFVFPRTVSIGVIGRCISCLTFFADIMIPGVPAVIVMLLRSSSSDEELSLALLVFLAFFGVCFNLNWVSSPLVSGANVEWESDCRIFRDGAFIDSDFGPGVRPAFKGTTSLRKYVEDLAERHSLYCLLSGWLVSIVC